MARAALDLMGRQDVPDGVERGGDCKQRNDFACAEYALAESAACKGYCKEQAQPTCEMFQKTARVATEYASTAAR